MTFSFKKFISEAAVRKHPNFESLDNDEAVDFIKNKCKNALWMFEQEKYIWRGEKIIDKPLLAVDTTTTERISQNNSNHYTIIIDNHPKMKDFPKRSRSFICSTSLSHAKTYAKSDVYCIIPSDTAKIANINSTDIWLVSVNIFDTQLKLHIFSYICDKNLQIPDKSIEDFQKFDQKLKDNDPEAVKKFITVFGHQTYTDYSDKFLEEIWRAFDPKAINFEWGYSSNHSLLNHQMNELYVSGEILMIKESKLKTIRELVL